VVAMELRAGEIQLPPPPNRDQGPAVGPGLNDGPLPTGPSEKGAYDHNHCATMTATASATQD